MGLLTNDLGVLHATTGGVPVHGLMHNPVLRIPLPIPVRGTVQMLTGDPCSTVEYGQNTYIERIWHHLELIFASIRLISIHLQANNKAAY